MITYLVKDGLESLLSCINIVIFIPGSTVDKYCTRSSAEGHENIQNGHGLAIKAVSAQPATHM